MDEKRKTIYTTKLEKTNPRIKCIKSLNESDVIEGFDPDSIIQIVKSGESYDVFYKTANYKKVFEKWEQDNVLLGRKKEGIFDLKKYFYKSDLDEATDYFVKTLNSCEIYSAAKIGAGLIKINRKF